MAIEARRVCHVRSPERSRFVVPSDLQVVATTFVIAQEKRHVADYDPGARLPRADVLALLRAVDDAMTRFETIHGQIETDFFPACLLAWGSLTRREAGGKKRGQEYYGQEYCTKGSREYSCL
jgi:hypothetical protein